MRTAVIKGLVLSALMFTTNTLAAKIPLLRVTSDKYPKEEYFLGVEVDAKNQVQAIYYQDNFQKVASNKMRVFSLSELEDSVVLLESDGTTVISLSGEKNEGELDFDLKYLKFYPVRKHIRLFAKADANGRYHVYERRTGNEISQMRVDANRVSGKEVGVSIQTQ